MHCKPGFLKMNIVEAYVREFLKTTVPNLFQSERSATSKVTFIINF